MREILFRGKDVDNGAWHEGQYIHLHKTTYCFGGSTKRDAENEIHQIVFEVMTDWNLPNRHLRADVIPETVGQYTGLTDKNGKKIFEGDYWLDTDDDYLVYVVEFREGQFGFVCYGWQGALMPYGFDENAGGFGEIDFSPMTDFNIDLIEIDGNIHDNPELLEGGE